MQRVRCFRLSDCGTGRLHGVPAQYPFRRLGDRQFQRIGQSRDTLLRWHRAGFQLFWRQRSKADARREPKLAPDLIALIRQMATSNVTWGAERIRGELLKLGIRVSKRTIQKYLRGARPRPPHLGQRWRTFLRDHTVWACDFVQTYDIWFRPIFAFFIVDINSKTVVHLAATYNPTRAWTAQQLRNATPFGEGPQFIIRDRDDKYGAEFDRVAKGAGVRVIRSEPNKTVAVPVLGGLHHDYRMAA